MGCELALLHPHQLTRALLSKFDVPVGYERHEYLSVEVDSNEGRTHKPPASEEGRIYRGQMRPLIPDSKCKNWMRAVLKLHEPIYIPVPIVRKIGKSR